MNGNIAVPSQFNMAEHVSLHSTAYNVFHVVLLLLTNKGIIIHNTAFFFYCTSLGPEIIVIGPWKTVTVLSDHADYISSTFG